MAELPTILDHHFDSAFSQFQIDREIVRNLLKEKRHLLKKEKSSFLNENIAEAEGKSHFSILSTRFFLRSRVLSFLVTTPFLILSAVSVITF
jgi:hypothetical protein